MPPSLDRSLLAAFQVLAQIILQEMNIQAASTEFCFVFFVWGRKRGMLVVFVGRETYRERGRERGGIQTGITRLGGSSDLQY